MGFYWEQFETVDDVQLLCVLDSSVRNSLAEHLLATTRFDYGAGKRVKAILEPGVG